MIPLRDVLFQFLLLQSTQTVFPWVVHSVQAAHPNISASSINTYYRVVTKTAERYSIGFHIATVASLNLTSGATFLVLIFLFT